MRTAAIVVALALSTPAAIADTVSASFSNLTLSGMDWGSVMGGVNAVSQAPGSERKQVYKQVYAVPAEPLQAVSGGVSALMGAGASSFLLTFEGSVPGTYYGAGIGMGWVTDAEPVAIAPGATVRLSADFSASIARDVSCASAGCASDMQGALLLSVFETESLMDGFYYMDPVSFSSNGSDSFARRLEVSHTNTSESWQYAKVDASLRINNGGVAPIPEPSTYALMALGVVGITFRLRRVGNTG